MTNQIEAMKLLSHKKTTSHVLHLILSLISMGLWLPVWVIVVISNALENSKIDRKIGKL